jgi:hypothetical protein
MSLDNVIRGDGVDDHMGFMPVNPHGRRELGALPRQCRHGGDRFEQLGQGVDIAVGLRGRPILRGETPDFVEIVQCPRREPIAGSAT